MQAFTALLNLVMMSPFHNQMHVEEKTFFSSLCLKSKVSAGVTTSQIDATVGKVHGIEQPRVGEGFGEGCALLGVSHPALAGLAVRGAPAGLAVCLVGLIQQSDFC